MTRRPPFLLIAALLLQAILAPAHGLAMAGHGLPLALCTADGVKRADDNPAVLPHLGDCLACHALPAGAALDPPSLPPPSWSLIGQPVAAAFLTSLPSGRRGPPGGARAPPRFS
ncbi:hypothetical protein JMJ56_00425 [Belnapia sp. T18]|uniref:DUF2946 domain-containing protein n=1 Tax=Belnapia arida TaxID=2804533 RepID=A0ABS1TVH3_9PROT|nr:hypothetical protein [Belnapia arida]MBL6076445.1 hypothetical protein [Belnapia arida]